jgi:hypothetical protein
MRRAAASAVSLGETHSTADFMISLHSMATLSFF